MQLKHEKFFNSVLLFIWLKFFFVSFPVQNFLKMYFLKLFFGHSYDMQKLLGQGSNTATAVTTPGP